MDAIVVKKGDSIDYTPGGAVAAGAVVVQGALIGVATNPIAANTLGALVTKGVVEFPKVKGDSGLTMGAIAYWYVAGNTATSTVGSNVYLGKVVKGTTTETRVLIDMAGPANASGAVGFGAMPSATIAASGTGSGDSPITTGFTLVSAANATKAVTLPAAAAGIWCIVKNNAAAALKVFPATNDKINGGAATTGFLSMAQYTSALFVAYDGTDWYSLCLVPS